MHRLIAIRLLAACVMLIACHAQASEKLRVFILAGQSNMQGLGQADWGRDYLGEDAKGKPMYGEFRLGGPGSLRYQAQTADPDTYGKLVDSDGKWIVREDVFIWSRNGQDIDGVDEDDDKNNDTLAGPLTVGYGARPKDGLPRIGPEFGFGHAVGDAYEEQVALIKIAWGGKALAYHFRPPSARIDDPSSPRYLDWSTIGVRPNGSDAFPPEGVGQYYDLMIRNIKDAMVDLAKQFPDKEIVLSGLGWHQGFNDRLNGSFRAQYEANLVDFINDIRKDLDKPGLPIVIATTGMNPLYRESRNLELHRAQTSVADPKQYPAFAGSVAAVDTRGFWLEHKESPRPDGPHWNQNGKSYYLIGTGMGKAMVELAP